MKKLVIKKEVLTELTKNQLKDIEAGRKSKGCSTGCSNGCKTTGCTNSN